MESAAYDDPADNTDGPYTNFSGTSEAAPTVTGSLGLLVELMRWHRGDNYEPPACLLKGTIIHTADDILNVGPDYQSGWGLVNAESAAELINQSETTHQGQNVRMVVIQNGATVTIPVIATGGMPLKVTVCSTDPAGTEPALVIDIGTRMLVNDFQLKVTSGGSTFNPFVLDPANPAANATTGVNDRDNVEQVLVSNPGTGQSYNIELSPATGETFVDDTGNSAAQQVAVLISGIDPNPALELVLTSVTQTGADKFTLVWPALIGSAYRIQESTDLTMGSFVDITGDIIAQTAFVASEVTGDPTTVTKKFWRVRKVQ